jgi:hypothetical protein
MTGYSLKRSRFRQLYQLAVVLHRPRLFGLSSESPIAGEIRVGRPFKLNLILMSFLFALNENFPPEGEAHLGPLAPLR